MLRIDLSNSSAQAEKYAQGLQQAHTWLQEATGRGNDFVGWVNLPRDYDKEEYARIQAAAKKIQSDSKALVSGQRQYNRQRAGYYVYDG